jgi:hypothetical protein
MHTHNANHIQAYTTLVHKQFNTSRQEPHRSVELCLFGKYSGNLDNILLIYFGHKVTENHFT